MFSSILRHFYGEATGSTSLPYKPHKQWRDLGQAKSMNAWAVRLGTLLSLFVATQVLADDLGRSPELGRPHLVHYYGPWQGAWWAWQLATHNHATALIRSGIVLGACLLLTMLLARFVYNYLASIAPKGPDTCGSAHFASEKEVGAMGILNHGKGVYLATWVDKKWGPLAPWLGARYLMHDGQSNLLVVASPGTGKTTGNVIPTACTYERSMIILDPKAEIYGASAGWRKDELGSKILLLDLADESGRTCRYNPLAAIALHTNREVRDVQSIVHILSDPDGKGFQGNEVHFANVASSFVCGVILHVLKTAKQPEDRTFRGVDARISNPNANSIMDLLKEMKAAVHDPHYAEGRTDGEGNRLYLRNWTDTDGQPTYTDPFIAQAAQDMLDKSETERNNVLSTAKRFLLPCRDPIIAKNMEACDFDPLDFQDPRQIVTLYLSSSAAFKQNLKPIHRVIINQLVTRMIEEVPTDREDVMRINAKRVARGQDPFKTKDCEVLFMMDEFATALGKLQIFADTMNLVRGYGIRVCVIVQDYAQIDEFYSKDESITSSTQVTVVYTPNRIETAEKISRILGKMTERIPRKTKNAKGRTEETFEDRERELMKADEVRRLHHDDAIVICEGETPILAKKIRCYKDKEFVRRMALPVPDQSDRLPARRAPDWNHDALVQAQEPILAKLRDDRAREDQSSRPRGGPPGMPFGGPVSPQGFDRPLPPTLPRRPQAPLPFERAADASAPVPTLDAATNAATALGPSPQALQLTMDRMRADALRRRRLAAATEGSIAAEPESQEVHA